MILDKVLLSLLMILFGISVSSATTINVGPGQTYTTIQSAIDASNTDDVISVSEGTYFENIVIKANGILLIGNNKDKTIIDGKQTGSVIRIESNNVTVTGFTLLNNGGSGKEDAGITIYSANNNMVANSIILNNTVGIAIYSSSNNNAITGNYIKSNYREGIFVFNSNDNKIYNNNIQNNKIGFYGDSARMNNIYSNNFIDNNDQAYDDSGMNSWDDGKTGNYWSNYKGTGAYDILGPAKTRDNHPITSPVIVKDVAITTPTEKPRGQKTQEESGKSSSGFTGIVVLISLIMATVMRYKK